MSANATESFGLYSRQRKSTLGRKKGGPWDILQEVIAPIADECGPFGLTLGAKDVCEVRAEDESEHARKECT